MKTINERARDDLIIEDLNNFFCADNPTHNPLINIINKRFGDLE